MINSSLKQLAAMLVGKKTPDRARYIFRTQISPEPQHFAHAGIREA